MNKRSIAHIALVFTNIFFAINLSAVKHLTNNNLVQAFGLNVVRIGFSVILFWILYVINPVNIKIDKADRMRLFLCALFGIAINQLMFIKGLSLTYSIHAALLLLITPILIVIIAAWILKERLGILKVTGLVLGISGALVLVLAKDSAGNGDNVLLGDLFIIINAISYTIYFILVKPLMVKYNAIVVLRWVFTIGLVLVLPFGWVEFTEIPWGLYTAIDFTSMGLIVITGTFLAYLFNLYGIKMLGPSVAGFYIYTQPVFAALIAMFFLHEQLTLYKIFAAALIFSGVYLANKQIKND
ncbi:MAG: DMT family transporter [Chitinophagaceae bacterium]|nr:DMT family transporter [Chitinophagaceae bacterium]